MSSIESVIAENIIVVFSDSGCPYCQDAIRALKAAGKEFTLIEATREQRQALKTKTNVSSVPSIWVKGTYVGGCNDGPESWMGIKKMLNSGKLEEMLTA